MEFTIKNRKGELFIVLYDECDKQLILSYRWHVMKHKKVPYVGTVIKNESGKFIAYQLHRMILGAKKGEVVDHKNHNPLDNRRDNIRPCTYSQNLCNIRPKGKSMYLGVSINNDKRYKGVQLKKYQSAIRINGKKKNLGLYEFEKDAAIAYDIAAKIHHGEFANLNFKTTL